MSQYLNEVFNGEHGSKTEAEAKPEPQHEAQKPEPQQSDAPVSKAAAEQPTQTADKAQGDKPDAGATAAPEDDKRVPLAALEAERKGRQDWKEKALRAEGRIEELERRQRTEAQQPGQQQPAQQQDPMQMMQQQIINERFNNSEMSVRAQFQNAGDVDQMVKVFSKHCEQNPALRAELLNQRHPWLFAYTEGKRLHLMAEMGGDPDAYRKKLEAEIEARVRAELTAAQGQNESNPDAPAARPNIPASLAGARSSAARSAPTWTGPPPLSTIFQ